MENKSLVVLVIEPEKKPYLKVLDGSLESMQQIVNGDIEAVYPFENEVAIVLNGEGKFTGESFNRAFFDEAGNVVDIIAGTFFVCYAPADSENFMSLPEEFIHKYADIYNDVERFANIYGRVLVQSWDSNPHSYLGVNYLFHEHENSTDIEFFVDAENKVDYEDIDWHTVEDGSVESKNIEQVAKEWAGNLAIGRVNAVLGVLKEGNLSQEANKSVSEIVNEARERSEAIGSNEYYKENDGWFTYYVNSRTGEKKFELAEGDVEVAAPQRDDFSRDEVLE